MYGKFKEKITAIQKSKSQVEGIIHSKPQNWRLDKQYQREERVAKVYNWR